MRYAALCLLLWLALGCNTPEPPSPSRPKPAKLPPPPPPEEFNPATLREFQQAATRFHNIISVPKLEQSPEAIDHAVRQTMTRVGAALDAIAACSHDKQTFANTIGALDDLDYEISLTANRLQLIQETSTNAALREAATSASKRLSEWAVGTDYRQDVYRAVHAYALTLPNLAGEDKKLLKDVLRDYRRAGLTLPDEARGQVEKLRKELARLTTDFHANITKAQADLNFTRAELEGVPEDFLGSPGVKVSEDTYRVQPNVTFQFLMVMENARREATRRKLAIVQQNLARAENLPVLQLILETRDQIAHLLGYPSWADYQTEPKMAGTAQRAQSFVDQLTTELAPKFARELAEFRQMKVKETGNAEAKIESWDWRYYANQLKKERYTVDAEQLRVYFPMEKTLRGMFDIYQTLFGLKIQRLDPHPQWVNGLRMYAVWDAETAEPLGLFYLDLYPREGKYNHFAQLPLIEGKRLPGGRYQRPTVALVCNFPPPSGDKPSLLSHADVVTLFHEFGHAMHSLLTRAQYARFAGTRVPRDFVEAPSQMFENWVWDKKVLDRFAADYRDSSKKIPENILNHLKEAKLATAGMHYRRQLALAAVDLALHTQVHPGGGQDIVKLSNDVFSKSFLPVPPDTAFVAYFGHLTSYDAGYYGYAWAEDIAADMTTRFENSHDGLMDVKKGRRLRNEIYAQGDSRDVHESIEKFLGRPHRIQPFLKQLGIYTK